MNETLVRIPLNTGSVRSSSRPFLAHLRPCRWKRVTIIRAITKTGVRGDVSYFAPCGRKLRSFQEIDRVKTFLSFALRPTSFSSVFSQEETEQSRSSEFYLQFESSHRTFSSAERGTGRQSKSNFVEHSNHTVVFRRSFFKNLPKTKSSIEFSN